MVNWFLTRVPKTIQWGKIVFSTNSAGATGYPDGKNEGGLMYKT